MIAARVCPRGQFQCKMLVTTSSCVQATNVCDGYWDCWDSSDEDPLYCENRVCEVGVRSWLIAVSSELDSAGKICFGLVGFRKEMTFSLRRTEIRLLTNVKIGADYCVCEHFQSAVFHGNRLLIGALHARTFKIYNFHFLK